MKKLLRQCIRFGLGPAAFYLLWFVVLTWPLVRTFATDIWAGPGDGLQMVWNLWWVNYAATELGQLPWSTHHLHFPVGTSLLVHTMHPLKGFMCIPLRDVLSLIECYNTMNLFSFVVSGVTAFWLALRFSRAYWPSLIGGFIFTFSNYHFAHMQGHMQLVSMEWIPLFVLLWDRLLERPRLGTAAGAALTLGLVVLCDHYYFLYCCLTAAFMMLWHAWRRRDAWYIVRRPFLGPMALFGALVLATSGVLVGATLHFMHTEPQGLYFEASEFSMDALALLIPGAHWRFGELTQPYWSRIPGKIHGNSVHLGLAVLTLLGCAWVCRRRLPPEAHVRFWLALAATFAVLALGPRLYIAGWQVPYLGDWEVPLLRMPYALLAKFMPGMQVGARPVRLVIVTILCASIIVPVVIHYLWAQGRRTRGWVVALLAVMVLEFWPSPPATFRESIPGFVPVLASRRDGGALYDGATPEPRAMYYQTMHAHPLAFGYISRAHTTLRQQKAEKEAVYNAGNYRDLRDVYGFRYMLTPAGTAVQAACPEAVRIYRDERVDLYDLATEPHDDRREEQP
ncbi:MAG: hypothetical protein O3B24_09605 [Verrucomicrobia bacterium]|nr:hypothetical protein [Verrucomicrobiota bacterium]